MQPAGEDRIREIFEEVAKGSNLDRALTLIADHTAAYLGAPTCKVWVVKRGDICDRCPLASVCSNRQMCMHLVAASGAVIEKEYPRIPLSVLSASMIARGGASDFSDSSGVGEKLFGLQHGAQSENRDSYALYPLRGASGTVGLIGIFNHRPIAQVELRWLAQLAPAAVAAIRVAELQSRSEALRTKLEREIVQAQAAKTSAATRETELEDAVAQLTLQVAQLQVEREPLVRAREEAVAKAEELEESNRQFERSVKSLEAQNRELREQTESLLGVQQQSGRTYSEMAAHLESERRRIEEENAWLKGRLETHEQSLADQGQQREALAVQLTESNRKNHSLTVQLDEAHSELASVREQLGRLQERVVIIEETNKGLRDHNSAITESVDDLERSLRIAEEARARLEQTRVVLEQQVERSVDEVARLRVERDRISGENEQLVTETERLREELVDLRANFVQLDEECSRANAKEREISQARSEAEARARRFETENAALWQANAGLEQALKQFQDLTARLEENASKLKDRTEANDHARAELEQRLRKLTEQNRRITLESQAQARFMANMSHELRTPMNAIIGFTSLLLEDRSLHMTDRHRRSLERVSRNARDLLELINNVLDLSKIDAGRMDVYSEPADVRDLIERAIGVVDPLKESRPLKLVIDVEDDLPTIRTDRTKLQQILINLLSNAIKFTPEGEVKVTAERSGTDAIRIAVSDTGVGLSVSDFPKLFQEFQQFGASDQIKQGSGLGLAITRRLVELLGGEISVSSKPAEGSVFAVTLPIEIEGRAAEASEADSLVADPDRTALVIDADPASLYLIKKYLGDAGYSVAATDDSERGLEIARMAKPSVVTIDLDLLDNGATVIRKIAEAESEAPIVAISGDPQLEQTAKEAGATAFLVKPIDRNELVALVARGGVEAKAARVLVVDDDPDTLDLVMAMLEGNGYQLRTARQGREALDEIARSRPDVIILDLMLPEMDGFEVIHRLSLNPDWRHIPVILLTARDLSHEERRALDIGTARIMQKGSYSRDELLAELKSVLSGQSALTTGQ